MDNNNTSVQTDGEVFSMRDYFLYCLEHWKWFLISVIVICGIGVLYILRQQPQYLRSMQVLIKDDENSPGDLSDAFSNISIFKSKANANNELISITSPAVLEEVIGLLGIEVNYMAWGLPHGTTLYGPTQPFIVKFLNVDTQEGAGFRARTEAGGKLHLYGFYKVTADGKRKLDGEVDARIDSRPIKTPVGDIVIAPNPKYRPRAAVGMPEKVYVGKMGLQNCIEYYSKRIVGDFVDQDADVLELDIRDVSTTRAVDILNKIVEVYNRRWVEDKNKLALATADFIDERLRLIEQELGMVDSDVADFKSANLIPDLEEAAKQSVKQSASIEEMTLELSNERAMTVYLREYLSNPANTWNVIPMNTGVRSPALEAQIGEYNQLLLARNNMLENSSEKNPLVIDFNAQLKGLRESIVKAIRSHEAGLEAAMRNMQGARGEIRSQLSSGPKQAKSLLGVERQQKVKESLYIFLLKKREENQLTQAFNAYNTRVITPPTGPIRPIAPRKMMILVVCFVIAVILPAAYFYVIKALDTKVRTRKDLERVSAPFIGEIPFVGKKRGWRKLFSRGKGGKAANKRLEKVERVVERGRRDAAAESFRIVRGNLDLLRGKENRHEVLMLTSFMAGSGKSFVTFNLGLSYAIKGASVLIVDCDLRHGSTSQFVGMPPKGLSDYLNGCTDNWEGLLVGDKDFPELTIMPIGHRPPNPAELLESARFREFVDQAREKFDYVILDCPPVDAVVDTQTVGAHADRTIFVVRAGLLDKGAVPEVDELYRSGRFCNMCILLNGTDMAYNRYHSYGYYGQS